jgi:hypothetical protein
MQRTPVDELLKGLPHVPAGQRRERVPGPLNGCGRQTFCNRSLWVTSMTSDFPANLVKPRKLNPRPRKKRCFDLLRQELCYRLLTDQS